MMDIEMALARAVSTYPYYARGFASLTPVEKLITLQGIPTLGIDKHWRIYWSQDALEKFSYTIPYILRHELEHLLRDHAGRCKARYPTAWNIACDAEINDDIKDLPEDCVFPEKLGAEEGLTAEEYYRNIDIVEAGTEGSGVTGVPEEWELPGNDSEIPSVQEGDSDILREQIANDVIQHSKERGGVPSGILVWAEAIAKGRMPKISWIRAVATQLDRISAGRTDWSYVRSSRRQNHQDRCLLPGTIKYVPTIGVVIDTSGSMSGDADWVAGILKDISRLAARSILIDCDTNIHDVRPLKHWRDVLKSRGGGGTDMRVGMEAAQKQNVDYTIILTDGYTPWPDVWPKNMIGLICNEGKTQLYRGS
jgi:predicted metal-dependent peptidase